MSRRVPSVSSHLRSVAPPTSPAAPLLSDTITGRETKASSPAGRPTVSPHSVLWLTADVSQTQTCLVSPEDGKKSLPVPAGVSTSPGTMIYAGNIGTQIANELLDFNRWDVTRALCVRSLSLSLCSSPICLSRMNSSPSSGNVSPFSLLQDKSPQTHQPVSYGVSSWFRLQLEQRSHSLPALTDL